MRLTIGIILIFIGSILVAQQAERIDSFGLGYHSTGYGVVNQKAGILMVGVTSSDRTLGDTPESNFIFLRHYQNQVLIWEKRFFAPAHINITNVLQASDGSIYFAVNLPGYNNPIVIEGKTYPGGYQTGRGTYLLKFAADGSCLWVKGEPVPEGSQCIAMDKEENVYLLTKRGLNCFVRKYTPGGQVVLSLVYPRESFALAVDDNSAIYINSYDGHVSMYSPAGTYQTEVRASGFHLLAADSAGVFVLTASGNPGIAPLSKFKADGTLLWAKNTVLERMDNPVIFSRHGLVYATTANSEVMTVASFNGQGTLTWSVTIPGFWQSPLGIWADNEACYVTGYYKDEKSTAFLYRIALPENITSIVQKVREPAESFLVSPNPSGSVFYIDYENTSRKDISLCVYTASGAQLLSRTYCGDEGPLHAPLDLSTMPRGIYLVTLETAGKKVTRRIVLQ
jgi:hypothetical protein